MSWFRRRSSTNSPPPPSSRQLWSDAGSEELIGAACAERIAGVVVAWPHGSTAPVVFRDVRSHELRLELLVEGPDATFPALAVANVSFHFRGRARVFLAPILGVESEPATGARLLRLVVPVTVAGAEARLSFRVPAPADGSVSVELRTPDGDALPGRLVNLSVSGLLVELPSASEARLDLEANLAVRLAYAGREVRLSAIVRRIEGNRYGLFFAEIIDRLETPDARVLRAMVAELAERWTADGRRTEAP